MNNLTCLLLLLSFVGDYNSLGAQLDWLLPPIVEDSDFAFINKKNANQFVFVGDSSSPRRIQRLDGSYAFGGQEFTGLRPVASSEIWIAVTADKETIVFNAEEKILSEGYDQVNCYYRTNILMVKKDDLFGLIEPSGKVIRAPSYKNLRRKKQGEYYGELPNGQIDTIWLAETDGFTDERRASDLAVNSKQVKNRIIIKQKSKKSNSPFYGMTDMSGRVIVAADRYYSNYSRFDYDAQIMLAVDSKTDKEGALDKDGKTIIPFVYDKICNQQLIRKYYLAERGDSTYIVDFTGKEIMAAPGSGYYPILDEGLIRQIEDKEYRLFNLQFKEVFADLFDDLSYPRENSEFMPVRKNGKTGFYVFGTGAFISPRFDKVNGPIFLSPLAVKEAGKFGLFEVMGNRLLVPPTYNWLKRYGDYFLGTTYRKDSIKKEDGSFEPVSTATYYLHHEDGALVYGPSPHKLSFVQGSLWKEEVGVDSVRLHDFATKQQRLFTNREVKITGDVTQLSKKEYCFTADMLAEVPAPRYEFLDRKVNNHDFKRYQLGGKFGLFLGAKKLTEPIYDEIDPKYLSVTHGIKARVGKKWGILAAPDF